VCGIFGYTGDGANPESLIEGIKRLEYRGYDSWGVCVARDGRLALIRRVGRIGSVDAAGLGLDRDGPCMSGIAHTRWATHGAPTEVNAHPHIDCAGKIAVIHNGIIENHAALRASLQAQGHVFTSETDTEVVPHLIEEFLKSEASFSTAFLGAMKLLVGAYGIAASYAGEPGTIFVARHGSPIVVGLGKNKTLVASDPAPLVAHTREVIYLDDGEIALLHGDGFETKTLEGTPVSKAVQQIAFSLPDIERGGFPHFMLKEISEQPESIRNAFRGRVVRAEGTAKLGGVDESLLRRLKRCHIIACGTSWHAGLIGKYLLESLARIPTQVSFGSEFRYANPVLEPDTLVIAISQSGETVDTLAGVREAKLIGAETMGICNVVGSTIARECGKGIYIHAGPEIGVASTKVFTSQLVVLSLLAMHLGRMRGLSLRAGLLFLDALEKLPDQAKELIGQKDRIKAMAARYSKSEDFLYIGRFYEYPTALEGALKLKEISYIHAEGVQAGEMKHGPIALIEPSIPTVVLAAQSEIRDKMLGNIHEVRARAGRTIIVAREGDEEVASLADDVIFIPATLDPLVPILAVIPLQLFAYFMAVARGCDVDKPRNLAKSVTVE
jgi:glucosamine--fructose-6-phosphate aminotransferase (isomerizing)